MDEALQSDATSDTEMDHPEEKMWTVDKIYSVRTDPNGVDYYRVSFKNCPKRDNTWIPFHDMNEALQQRVKKLKLRRAKPRFC